MLTSRNIHFAILGIILGASAGYIFAFYQAESAAPAPAAQAQQADGGLPAGHPGGDVASLEALKAEVDANPSNADALARYGTRLFTEGKIPEAISSYEKVLQMEPENITIRSLMVAMLFSEGNMPEAKKHLEIALKQNPNHIPTLHGYFLVTLEGEKDLKKAEEIYKHIEVQSPNYQGLPDLKARLEEFKGTQK